MVGKVMERRDDNTVGQVSGALTAAWHRNLEPKCLEQDRVSKKQGHL